MAWGLLLGAVAGAGGSWLGSKSKDKTKVKRKETPTRMASKGAIGLEAGRRLAGKKSFADELEDFRERSNALRDIELQQRSAMLELGKRGIESPGLYEKVQGMREKGLLELLRTRYGRQIARRSEAIPMLQSLMGADQPYYEQKTKEGPMWAKMLSGALSGGAMGYGMGGGAKSAPATQGAIPQATQASQKAIASNAAQTTASSGGLLQGNYTPQGAMVNKLMRRRLLGYSDGMRHSFTGTPAMYHNFI